MAECQHVAENVPDARRYKEPYGGSWERPGHWQQKQRCRKCGVVRVVTTTDGDPVSHYGPWLRPDS